MTESRPPYRAEGFDKDGYDANGFDYWGVSRAQKERALAKLARRFEEQPDTMAALVVEYRTLEGMSQEKLLAKLEITPAQYSHLALCLVPDPGAGFADDLNKIVAVSGANLLELATICREVYALRDFPARDFVPPDQSPEAKGSPVRVMALRSLAARDRAAKSMREQGAEYSAEYSADVNAPAASQAPAPAAPIPDEPSTETYATDAPATNESTTDAPTTDAPTTDAP